MKAYNKKRKPKHTTRLRYRVCASDSKNIQQWFPDYNKKQFNPYTLDGISKSSKTVFYKGKKIKKYTIPRIFIGEYT